MKTGNVWIRGVDKPLLRVYCDGRGRDQASLIGVVSAVPGKGLVLHRSSGSGVLIDRARSGQFLLPCRCRRRSRGHVVEMVDVRAAIRDGRRVLRVAVADRH